MLDAFSYFEILVGGQERLADVELAVSPVDKLSFWSNKIKGVSNLEFVDVLGHLAALWKSLARKVDLQRALDRASDIKNLDQQVTESQIIF